MLPKSNVPLSIKRSSRRKQYNCGMQHKSYEQWQEEQEGESEQILQSNG